MTTLAIIVILIAGLIGFVVGVHGTYAMTTLAIIGILIAGIIGFVIGVVYQSDNGPDYDDHE